MAGRVAYTGGIVRNGLVLNLDAAKRDSYPKTGTVWSDISGNGNNGILNGATGGLPSYNSANGGSIQFDGTDDYVDCGTASTSTIRGGSKFTVNYWFKKFSSSNDFLLGTLDNSANKGFYIQWFTDSNVYFGVYNGSRTYNITNLPYTTNWYNFTFTFDGTLIGATNILKLYINGILQASSNSGGMPTTLPTDILSLNIGKLTNYASIGKGNLANLQLYNKPLSATEVLQNYNALKNRYI